MEPMEAVLVLVLTLLLMFIVMSPTTWSSSFSSSSAADAAADSACDGDLYGYPSSCIAARLDFVFSPATPCSLFDDDSPSCNNSAVGNTTASNAGIGEKTDDLTLTPACMAESA